MRRHTRKWKEKEIEELKQLAEKYPVIAIADLSMFPASLFQSLRKKIHNKAVIRVSKTRIIKKALEKTDKKMLQDYANESCAIIFTEMNPFELYAFLKKNKGSTSAKPGMAAEDDIVIPAGDTGLPPGPAMSDLKKIGLSVRVEGPTIAVAEDKVVTKKGEPISNDVAATLSKLNIKPIKVGLNIIVALENNEIFQASVLNIDAAEIFGNFQKAFRNSQAVALEICYTTAETIGFLIQKAFRESKEVALQGGILNKETAPAVLAKADAEAKALKTVLPEAPVKEAPVEKAEGEKKEEAKEDAKKEKEAKEEVKEEKTEEKPEEAKEGEAKEGAKEKESEEKKKEEPEAKEKEGKEAREEKKEGAKEEKKEGEKPAEEKSKEAPKEEKAKEKPAEEKKEGREK